MQGVTEAEVLIDLSFQSAPFEKFEEFMDLMV